MALIYIFTQTQPNTQSFLELLDGPAGLALITALLCVAVLVEAIINAVKLRTGKR